MTSISVPAAGTSGLRSMAGIEARRFARHPAFLVGVALCLGVLTLLYVLDDSPALGDLLSIPILPAFFIGLPSLVAAARITRSTEVAVEAVATAPGTEARRTAAVAAACGVPFAAGVLWLVAMLALVAAKPPEPQEWWFGTMPDLQVWAILIALGPVACLGGGLLGVLTGRWLRFPGAPAVAVVATAAVTMVGQLPYVYGGHSELRLWLPWAMFTSGAESNGTTVLFAGNATPYLGYLLCLCAAAALVAVWHDRAARTARLRQVIAGVVVVGLACLVLAITTHQTDNVRSDPISYRIDR